MTQIRIVKCVHVTEPSYLIHFSIFNDKTKTGTMLETAVIAGEVEGKSEQEIADVAWNQVRAKAEEFLLQDSVPVGSLLNKEFVPTTPWQFSQV